MCAVLVVMSMMMSTVLVEAQDAGLKAAVTACLGESPEGDCLCQNGCGTHSGPIGQWDVSSVTDMTAM